MHQSINLYQFREAFRTMGRSDNFSYEGLEVLFDYLESYEEDTGEAMDLDVIALCCEYTEATIEDIASDYGIDLSDCDDEDDKARTVEDYLNYHTMVVGAVAGGFIYTNF